MKKKLYTRRKVVEYTASGNWDITKGEKTVMYLLMAVVFAAFAGAAGAFVMKKYIFMLIFLGGLVLGFLGIGLFLILTVRKKAAQEPMEEHLYKVDYTRNAVTGRVDDRNQELPIDPDKSAWEQIREHK